jgi:hypothetical protein
MSVTSEEGPESGYIIVSFIVRKTTSKLECVILTTVYLTGAKNTDKYSLCHPFIFRRVLYFKKIVKNT